MVAEDFDVVYYCLQYGYQDRLEVELLQISIGSFGAHAGVYDICHSRDRRD